MGKNIVTLCDLLPPGPRAICVGINPAPISVEVGHYFQGTLGRRFFGRLRLAGILSDSSNQFEDDALVAVGIGFTDIVKRPTKSASEVTAEERRHGARRLATKLVNVNAPVLIFPFKDAAVALIGPFHGNGWLIQEFAGARLFVMPGPYESNTTANPTIASLSAGLG